MIYSFTQDLNNIRSTYEDFKDELVKNNAVPGTESESFSNSKLAAGYVNPGDESADYDDDDYTNLGDKGNKKDYRNTKKGIAAASDLTSGKESGWSGGEGLTANTAMKGAGFAMNVGNAFSTTSASESEGWAQTGSMALQGAALGASVAGPYGAVIGGVVGGAAGIIDQIGDGKQRSKDTQEANDKSFESKKTQRELDYAIQKKQADIDRLMALRKNQLSYLDLKY